MMNRNFLSIHKSRYAGISSLLSVVLLPDDFRQIEEFGANLQSRALGRFDVHFEVDPFLFDDEVNHPSELREPFCLSHGQNARLLQTLENGRQVFSFRGTDESDLAAFPVLSRLPSPDDQSVPADGLVLHNLVQCGSKRVSPDDADGEGIAQGPRRVGWPDDKFGEIVQELRLDLVLTRIPALGEGARGAARADREGSNQSRRERHSYVWLAARNPNFAYRRPEKTA